MKKTIAIILLVMILLCSIPFSTLAATGTQVSIDDSNIVYTGRWISQTDGTLTANFNAGLEMRFTGTSVAVNLKASSGIAYSVDGGTWKNVIAPAGQYTLASGLTAGTHTLEMTVSFHDKHIYLEGFTLDVGASTVEALDKPTIEFIGDSITAGWIGSGYDNYNYVSNTYGFIAAENLDLYHDTVAFGGIAVVPGYGSPDNGGMQNRYDLISEYVAGESNVPKWDKSQYIPDYIVINLGTNDSAAASEFSKYYKQFLNSLRESYPNTKIVAMVPFNGAYRGAISSVITSLNDSNMFFLDTAGWVESTMTTDGVHLTVEAQKICGEYLTTALSNLINNGTVENADGTPIAPETTGKYYYANFTNGLSTTPTLSGNGSHKVYVYENLNTTYSVSNGELSLSLPNGSRLRLSNTINNLSRFEYFVIRVKGTVPSGAANAFTFNFGSYTTPGATFTVPASDITSEYTDLLFTMPEGYFDNITTAYEATLFIKNAGTSTVNLTIDEMYFTDRYPVEDDSSDDETGSAEKVYFSNFNSGLSTTPTATGNGNNTAFVMAAIDGTGAAIDYTCTNGVLNTRIGVDYQLRIQNSMTDIDSYKYMVLRMKGTIEYDGVLTGNALGFWFGSHTASVGKTGNLYMTVDQLTEDYSDVIIEIPEGFFDSVSDDYKACLCITSNRGSGDVFFDISIDEIYFCNTYVAGGGSSDTESSGPNIDKNNKVYYTNFDSGLSTTPTATGNGNNTAFVLATVGTNGAPLDYSCTNGVLNATINVDNQLRIQNTMTGIENYKYMVLRMKGTIDYDGVLMGNALSFWFGSHTPEIGKTGNIHMTVDQLTEDYSDVVIEIPEGFFDNVRDDYKACLCITSNRGTGEVVFNVSIDEIYFCNEATGDDSTEPSEPSNPGIDTTNKVYFSNFNSGLSTTPTATGNGNNTAFVMAAIDGTGAPMDYTCTDGVLSTRIGVDYQLRIQNSMTDIDSYKYMVLRMKGTIDYDGVLTGNALAFWFGSHTTSIGKTGNLYMTVDQLTEDYSDVIIEIPEGFFDTVGDDYKACLCITSTRGSGDVFFDISIDEIYFCNEASVGGGEDEGGDEGSGEDEEVQITGTAYSEFTDALVQGTAVSNGAGGTITLFNTADVTQSVSDGCLNVNFNAEAAYIRFTSSVELTEDCATSKYKYMIIRLKGSATKNGEAVTSGSLLKIVFGSWGNEVSPLYVDISQVNADTFSTVVLELSDANFAATHADYKTGLILRNPGTYSSEVVIDSIYFSDEKPSAPSEPEEDTPTIEKTYYNDFNSGLGNTEATATPTGNGSNTSFAREVSGLTYTCTDGVLNLKMTNGNFIRMANSMTGIENYKYMVVRMKGTHDRADFDAAANTIGFLFGTVGRLWDGDDSDIFFVPNGQLTSDYSDVVIEIPEGYFDAITDPTYLYDLFIVTKRGANFDISIDEIYFTDSLDGEEEEEHTHNVKYGVCTECGETVYLAGDANGDGEIDVRDLVRIKKIAAAKEAKTDASDINCDGKVDAQDTAAMRRGLVAGDLVKSVNVSFDSSVKMLGRVGGTDSQGRLVLEWTDSGFEFNFTGTGFSFDVAGINIEERFHPYIAYTIDGGEAVKTRVASSSAATISVSGLAYGTHTVKVLRINEPINNPIYVSSVKAETAMYGTGAALLAPNAASNKKILFIGDSITTGYGNIGTGNHPFDTADQDGMQTYAYLTAESLGADAMYVAREGRGIVNNSYNSEDSIVTMLNKKSLVLGTTYDYTSWTPDVIFVNAGTNDVAGGTTADAMTTGTVAFINSLKAMYPNAKIVWGYGAMGVNAAIQSGITSAINQINDSNVTYFEFTPVSGGGTYGHPDAEEHIALANELIPVLENVIK